MIRLSKKRDAPGIALPKKLWPANRPYSWCFERSPSPLRRARKSGGATLAVASVLEGLSLTYNRSNSFTPSGPAQDTLFRRLGNETAAGRDYGFWRNLADGGLIVRANWYEVKQPDRRNGTAATIAQRATRLDIYGQESVQLQDQANAWVTAQVQAEVSRQMKLTPEVLAYLETQFPPLAATEDSIAKGKELELNVNPTRFWTIAASGSETQAVTTHVSSSVAEWIALRMPVWTTIVDPRTNTRWWTTQYGSNSPQSYFATDVNSPYNRLLQQQGKSNPQIRRYRAKFSANLRLEGITEHRLLRKFNVGGPCVGRTRGRSVIMNCRNCRPASPTSIRTVRSTTGRAFTSMPSSATAQRSGAAAWGRFFSSTCAIFRRTAGCRKSARIPTAVRAPLASSTRGC